MDNLHKKDDGLLQNQNEIIYHNHLEEKSFNTNNFIPEFLEKKGFFLSNGTQNLFFDKTNAINDISIQTKLDKMNDVVAGLNANLEELHDIYSKVRRTTETPQLLNLHMYTVETEFGTEEITSELLEQLGISEVTRLTPIDEDLQKEHAELVQSHQKFLDNIYAKIEIYNDCPMGRKPAVGIPQDYQEEPLQGMDYEKCYVGASGAVYFKNQNGCFDAQDHTQKRKAYEAVKALLNVELIEEWIAVLEENTLRVRKLRDTLKEVLHAAKLEKGKAFDNALAEVRRRIITTEQSKFDTDVNRMQAEMREEF